jgi:hypothetical protein
VKRVAVGMTAAALACDAIVAQPLSEAPRNVCSQFACEGYARETSIAARCVRERCEITTAGGRPEFPFWIVVHVAETSFFAPGSTYVFFSDERGEPAFKAPAAGGSVACKPEQRCLTLPGLAAVTGSYLTPIGLIPVRVTYEQVGNSQQSIFPTLPLNPLFASTQLRGGSATTPATAQFSRAVPFGLYRRILTPEPPFDADYPPAEAPQKIEAGTFDDPFKLTVDDPSGDSRVATVRREDGLEGWRLFLVDATSKRRISVVKTLSGTSDERRLDTTGDPNATGLRDNVEAVLEPPASWIAIPRFVTPLFGGAGLRNIVYPSLPPPVRVSAVVAQPGNGPTLLGYPARVRFVSDILSTRTDPNPLLQYTTEVSTDERGRLSTVLPPGTYTAIVEPDVGTGFAKTRVPVVVDRTVTALTLQPPPRAIVRGRAVLSDGRPLAEADVQALPISSPEAPRPERTRTSRDGLFALELDPGPYTLSVVPKPGTGFPRASVSQVVGAKDLVLSDIRVPVPTVLTLTLFDASGLNPIVRSMVRIFARSQTSPTGDPVEIGNGITDALGAVEILLAGEPR